MAIYIAQQGDCISSIAHDHGFADWTKIYNDAGNADLRTKRPDPHLICAGDEVNIPALATQTVSCPCMARTKFILKQPPSYLNIRLHDQSDKAIADAPYTLLVEDQSYKGTTDDGGWVKQKILVSAKTGRLMVTPNPAKPAVTLQWDVNLGHLDPVTTLSGIKTRLNNLHYHAGDGEDEDDQYKSAVSAFQKDYDLPVNGVAGSETQSALSKAHRV